MQIRWGILGTGNIARQFAGGVRQSTTGTLAAVASRDATTADAFARSNGVATAYGDYLSMLNDPAVDAVYVSLPNAMHHAWTIKALRAGKHVLCEKPLAMNVVEAAEMFDVARQTGRVLIEAFMYRCHPQTRAVVDAVRRGDIGTPRLMRLSFCFRTTKIDGNIRFDKALGGGALMDVGCYCLSFARLIAGREPIDVFAYGTPGPGGVDVRVTGGLRFTDDLSATFACAMDTQSDNAAMICGDEGWLKVAVPWKPVAASSGYTIERQTPPKQDGQVAGLSPLERIDVPVSGDVYGIEADAFAAVIAGTAPPFVTADDSLGNIRLIERLQTGLF